jgi:hypothetical protein
MLAVMMYNMEKQREIMSRNSIKNIDCGSL